MTDMTMPERVTMWALRNCPGPVEFSKLYKATELSISKDTIEKALAGLIEMHLVEKLIVREGTQPGHRYPGRTLYSLTMRGYSWREDDPFA